MHDQTQTYASSGMGGANTSFATGGMDGGQSDEASASRRLRVRVAGTALFTVGLAALGYSMVDKSMENDPKSPNADPTFKVNEDVKKELPNDDPDKLTEPNFVDAVKPTLPDHPEKPIEKVQQQPEKAEHVVGHDGLHDFSGCGSFSVAFAHARQELGGPGEIFIYHGKPYTTTYKHEVEAGNKVNIHLENGLEVQMVVLENEDGSRIIAADTDKDGIADKWYFEDNNKRCELVDTDFDGKLDSYVDQEGVYISLDSPLENDEVTAIPGETPSIIIIDGVEFLAYSDGGNSHNLLVGEYQGQILSYKDTDGDGTFDQALILNEKLEPVKAWEIEPVSESNLHISIPEGNLNSENSQTNGDISFIGPSEDPIINEDDRAAIEDDPYRIDIENEINSGDLNNHAAMDSFGN